MEIAYFWDEIDTWLLAEREATLACLVRPATCAVAAVWTDREVPSANVCRVAVDAHGVAFATAVGTGHGPSRVLVVGIRRELTIG